MAGTVPLMSHVPANAPIIKQNEQRGKGRGDAPHDMIQQLVESLPIEDPDAQGHGCGQKQCHLIGAAQPTIAETGHVHGKEHNQEDDRRQRLKERWAPLVTRGHARQCTRHSSIPGETTRSDTGLRSPEKR